MVDSARDVVGRTGRLMSIALVAFGIGATANVARPQPAAPPEEEEYGEFLARKGRFWRAIAGLGGDFTIFGFLVVGVFAAAWLLGFRLSLATLRHGRRQCRNRLTESTSRGLPHRHASLPARRST
jgi:hypothetical protein